MTRLPLESRDVQGVDGPEYPLNLVCPVPGCGLETTETHHLFRRSFLAGDYTWVRLPMMPDNIMMGNLIRLCNHHHHMVTINAAWLRLEDDGVLTWSDMVALPEPLLFQPPLSKRPGVDVLSDLDGEVEQPDGDHQAEDAADRSPLVGHEATVPGTELDGTCPTCLRPLPHKKEEHEKARVRRTWSVTVPKDEREDGAETLDTLLEAARETMARAGLPYGAEETVKFFVLTAALGLFVQHAEDVLA